MSKEDRTEAVQHIHVFVAIQIPKVRPFRALRNDRIDDFFPLRSESGNYSGISQRLAMLFGETFGLGGSFGVSLDKRLETFLLPLRELSRNALLWRLVWAEGLKFFLGTFYRHGRPCFRRRCCGLR